MRLVAVDWAFIIGYCIVAFVIGVWYSRRASRNIDEFFVAGRTLPWWLAGTSIVATTFAADTPLAVSAFIRHAGIYENWLWWNALMGGILTVYFYARLWRRAGVITDVEFIEFRYSGKPASALRGFMAVYGGVLQNAIIMGWVMLAMLKILVVMLNLDDQGMSRIYVLAGLVALTLFYTVMSGFWGVVMTDLVQFIMAMTGSIALGGIVLWNIGGPSGMVESVTAAPTFRPEMLHLMPDLRTAGWLAIITFGIQVTVQWWGGGQGGGYLAQRLFSCRTERDSVLASLWFNFAHYVLRPWPWLIVGIVSIVYIPIVQGEDHEMAYPLMMARFLPDGLRGLMVASLLAAFMSTMDTQLNWGASYLTTDLYKRFMVKDAPDTHYVWVSRIAMVFLALCAALVAWQAETIRSAWVYLIVLTSGAGFVGLLRWYWWRVNAWSEISALVASFIIANGLAWVKLVNRFFPLPDAFMEKAQYWFSDETFAIRLVIIIGLCTALWVAVTFLTRPVPMPQLERFYRRVRPGGWWGPVAVQCPDVVPDRARAGWLGWFAAVVCIYCGLFGIGYICLNQPLKGLALLAFFAVTGWIAVRQASAIAGRQ